MKPKESQDVQLPPLLRKCWMKLNAIFQKRVGDIGLTPDQYIALRWLNELPPGTVYQFTLKNLMFTDPNNIAGLMSRMDKMGLVKRRVDALDRRKKLIYCTPKGKDLFDRAKKVADRLEEETLSVLSPKEKEEFLGLLGQVNRHLHPE
jgi:DNA-binding MarR family transcriptional regulator